MADRFKPCSVDECNGNAHYTARGAKSLCNKHYKRMQLHGDPLGGITGRGVIDGFLADLADGPHERECRRWPYGISRNGYGVVKVGGRSTYAHRYICEIVHGAPPTTEHQAAHVCGNRACVNPSHLEWKTASENALDKLTHGTHNRGERQWMSKLTEDQAREIIALKGIKTQRELAERFGVVQSTVSHIQRRKVWSWL